MQMKNYTTEKKIVIAFIVLIALIVISAGTSFLVARNETKKVQKNLVTTIKGDLGEYLSDYVAAPTGKQGDITPDDEEIILSQEQIDAIIDSVSSSVEYSLIKDTISKYSSVSEDSLAALKSNISSQINEILNSNEETKNLTETEKESIINTISTIIKHDILDIMKEYEANNVADIQLVKESMEKDIAELKDIINSYNEKFTTLQNTINALDKTSSSDITNVTKDYTEKITNLQNIINNLEQNSQEDVSNLMNKYDSLFNQYTAISKSIEYLEKLNIETELTKIKKNIETNKNDIHALVQLLDNKFKELNSDLSWVQNSLGTQISNTNAALQNYTKNATAEAKKALQEEIENTKNALTQEMQGATEEQKKNLQDIYNELLNAQKELETSNENDMSSLENALNQNVSNINNLFEAYKKSIQDQIDATNSNLDTLKQTLTDTSAVLNGNIEYNKKEITAALQNASKALQANIDKLGAENANALIALKDEIDAALKALTSGSATKEELEAQINAVNNKIVEVTGTKITELKNELTQKITDNTTAISNLSNTLSTSNQTLTQAIEDLKTSVGTKDTELSNAIKELQDNVSDINEMLEKKAIITYKVKDGKGTLIFSEIKE